VAGVPGATRTVSGVDPSWLGFEAARDTILVHCHRLQSERVAIADALGRALSEDVRSPLDHPPWDNSAMDGFAVRVEDVRGASAERPVRLPISDDIPAGGFPSGALREGTAARVMTGAPIPPGSSGVIRVEHTDGGSKESVGFTRDSDAERNIRRAAEDVRAGDVILAAGRELTPAAIGVLAMTGQRDVTVGRRPRIGVLANGDELVDFDRVQEALESRRIMNSNSYALAAQLADSGADAVLLGIAGDDPASVREKMESAADCDGVISTAGVSVGEHDHVRAALGQLGAKPVFWRARIRPGGPIALNMLEGRPVWSLPGNPVSAMVTFEIFLRPAIRKMAGHGRLLPRLLRARTRESMRSVTELTHFLRVTIEPAADGPPWVALTGPQGSGILTSMSEASGLAIVPEGVGELAAETAVDVLPLRR